MAIQFRLCDTINSLDIYKGFDFNDTTRYEVEDKTTNSADAE